MPTDDDRPGGAKATSDYRSLPRDVRLDETIATVEAETVPDPRAGRNVDQHRALRDD
ncbi:hypothetical protein ENKNEFLB_03925 [Nocardioides aquaticus]|jgi:hypothetical protein|uniref:Uncharacterized protein n=1 Tax=Nocardioides aquaticus TaxID=160826 RepID=A0ABX8ENU6_9ACTN|nr:hypothetical protein [Nocardioides aquaticus]QVT81515.1 hypothetical protein ENKNEFLB_03925 [Nocardioides aquaticus]